MSETEPRRGNAPPTPEQLATATLCGLIVRHTGHISTVWGQSDVTKDIKGFQPKLTLPGGYAVTVFNYVKHEEGVGERKFSLVRLKGPNEGVYQDYEIDVDLEIIDKGGASSMAFVSGSMGNLGNPDADRKIVFDHDNSRYSTVVASPELNPDTSFSSMSIDVAGQYTSFVADIYAAFLIATNSQPQG